MTRRTPTWRDDAEQSKATGGQPFSLLEFQIPQWKLDQTPSPKEASQRTWLPISWAGLSPWAEAMRCVIWSRLGSSRTSRARDARHPKRASYLCCTLPDELEGVQAVYATDRLNDEEIYWSVFCSRPKTGKVPLFLLNGSICKTIGSLQIVHWRGVPQQVVADPNEKPRFGETGALRTEVGWGVSGVASVQSESELLHVDGGSAVRASSFNRQGSPRSLSCATT